MSEFNIVVKIMINMVWFFTLMVAYLEGQQVGRDKWIAFTEKID
jgi:hypothetical protein